MKLLRYLLLLGTLVYSAPAFSQTTTVSGNVTSASDGLPIPGATIAVKGTTSGTQTDFDGNFRLSDVPQSATLVVSYVGYLNKEVAAGANLNIQLTTDVAQLNEVVVIGYGTQKKKELTGSVGLVSAETIEDLKPQRIEQALQGQVAGVNITSQSGSPGSASNIRIRGISTNGDNRPLILLDGNVIEDLSVVNPGDIENITVLKDATAGIYGVRAANGVILITTKKGRKNRPLTYQYDAYAGFQKTTRRLPLLNATEYALLRNEAAAANGQALVFPDVSQLGRGTDWQDQVFENAPVISHNFSGSGGTEKSTYAFGASLLTQDGIVGGSKANFTRYTTRLNYGYTPIENLDLKANFIYTGTQRKSLPEGGLGSVLFNAVNVDPTIPVRNPDGTFGRARNYPIEVINPVAQIASTFNRSQVDKISGVLGASYKFLNHFTATANYQWNYSEVNSKGFFPITDFGNPNPAPPAEPTPDTVFDRAVAVVTENENFFRDYTFDAFIKYEQIFNDVHNLGVTLGTSIFKTTGDAYGFTGVGTNATTLENANVDDAVMITDNFINQSNRIFDSRLLSYFARAQYDYGGKYFVSALVRRDGSSAFGPENKFGVFPSASVGWIASEENFLSDVEDIQLLKIRGSYGIVGNDRIGSFGFVSLLNGESTYVFDNALAFGTAVGAVANPEIKWEEQTTLDIGLDVNVFNTISITADYFNKRTDDLLLVVQSSAVLGVAAPGSGNPIANAGSVRNKGYEFRIGYKDEISKDFSLDVSYNFTTIDNEVLSVNNQVGFETGGVFGIGQNPPSRLQVGQPIGVFYGLQSDGIFQNQDEVAAHPSQLALGANAQPGDIRYADVNGDGALTQDDRTFIGDPIPDVTMGLNINMGYKAFDFQAYFFASIGNDIVRNYDRNDARTNKTIYSLDRWTGEGTSNTNPRVTTGANTNFVFSDYFVEDGSFLRAQNMQLGYTIPQNTIDRVGLNKLRFYVAVNNVFTVTEYRGYDPTASNGTPIGDGIDNGFYPNPRTFLIGANLKF